MRSVIDPDPITWAQFVAGFQHNPDCAVCQLVDPATTPGTVFAAEHWPMLYITRIPNPRANGPDAPNAFTFTRVNYNGLEYLNKHEASYLYPRDKPVWLVRRAPSSPPTPPAPRRPPLPMPSPNRPQRPQRKPQPKVVNPTPPVDDIPSEF